MDFKVDRSKWVCGDGGENGEGLGVAMLENGYGFMCCLGHCERQLRPRTNLRHHMPARLTYRSDDPFQTMEHGSCFDSDLAGQAAEINDDKLLTTARRESALKTLFKEHGHTISFYGKTVRDVHYR